MKREDTFSLPWLHSYLDIGDLTQIFRQFSGIIFVSHGVGDLLQARPRVAAMDRESARMRSQHLLFYLQIEKLLGPLKSMS